MLSLSCSCCACSESTDCDDVISLVIWPWGTRPQSGACLNVSCALSRLGDQSHGTAANPRRPVLAPVSTHRDAINREGL